MSGNPVAFLPAGFYNTAFQTGTSAVVSIAQPTGMGGGHAESEFEEYRARRRARLRELEQQERDREELKEKIAAESKRLAAKKRAKAMTDSARQAITDRLAKFDRQMTAIDHRITQALNEIAAIEQSLAEQKMAEEAMLFDRRKRLVLVAAMCA